MLLFCHALHDMPVLPGDIKARLVAFTLMLAVKLCVHVLLAILKASRLIILSCLVTLLCRGMHAVSCAAVPDHL